ncbi:hypothetical protein B0H14DRAFT_2589871 [Mycena olivaceomarginata]|nr:hypothetical protein B0H14DRAFT_2589871 [Mycena olivaceomarginata]
MTIFTTRKDGRSHHAHPRIWSFYEELVLYGNPNLHLFGSNAQPNRDARAGSRGQWGIPGCRGSGRQACLQGAIVNMLEVLLVITPLHRTLIAVQDTPRYRELHVPQIRQPKSFLELRWPFRKGAYTPGSSRSRSISTMRWPFVFWPRRRRVDARVQTRRRAPGEVARDGRQRVEGGGVVAEDVAGQPRNTAQGKRDAARDVFVLCGCSPYHVAAFARRFRAVRNGRLAGLGSRGSLGVVYAGVEAIAGPPRGTHVAIVAAASVIACGPRAGWDSVGAASDGKGGRYDMHARPSLSRRKPRRRYGIAQTMTAQQGAAQGPCGAAHLSERVPVASGRLRTRKSDVVPRKCATYEEPGNSRFPGHPMPEIAKYRQPTQNHNISNLTSVLESNGKWTSHRIGLARYADDERTDW